MQLKYEAADARDIEILFDFNKELIDTYEDTEKIAYDNVLLWVRKKIEKNITGYFTDECIQKMALPTILPGKHTVELKLPLAPRTYTENCFILGDFGVRLEGIESTLIAPTDKIGFGSVVSQGMPFYGGNVVYEMEIDVPEDADAIRIHTPNYKGALISASVDGECIGKIVYQPYDLIACGVAPGKHKLELTLFGNRHNSFGSLHNTDDGYRWFGPSAWTMQGDSFSYEYNLADMGIMRNPEISFLKKN